MIRTLSILLVAASALIFTSTSYANNARTFVIQDPDGVSPGHRSVEA